MKEANSKESCWSVCLSCKGLGKKRRKLHKKAKLRYKLALEIFEKTNKQTKAPIPPKGQLYSCVHCSGSGIIRSHNYPKATPEIFPHIAIIGAGIGGVALAVACLHRGIPFTLYERDSSFDARSQGYGLTLQQASKAVKALGILSLEKGIISTKHIVHTPEGKIIGEWGMRKWISSDVQKKPKRTNIHISRQSLRLSILNQLPGHETVQWNHQLISFEESENGLVNLKFKVNGKIKNAKADLLVGADGIRSTVRKLLIGDKITPLHYLGCIVILGICDLKAIKNVASPLLDAATVFQTANGNERIYMMPYETDKVMWQLSFPIAENEAKKLNILGAKALKKEACKRIQWHDPIPQILEATEESLISGYPVYDRALLKPEFLAKSKQVTLIGDAAHPMSPFKGQGANQALLDALSLSREIYKGCRPSSNWKEIGLKDSVLRRYESEMIIRSTSKVIGSAEAAKFLHSKAVLNESNETRGKA